MTPCLVLVAMAHPCDAIASRGIEQVFAWRQVGHPNVVAIRRQASSAHASGENAQSVFVAVDGRLHRFRSDQSYGSASIRCREFRLNREVGAECCELDLGVSVHRPSAPLQGMVRFSAVASTSNQPKLIEPSSGRQNHFDRLDVTMSS